jgi:hypothetical protein
MTMLETYANFSPTPMDTKGLGLSDKQDWLVAPVMLNRDSGVLDRSNWEVVTKDIQKTDPEGETLEIHRFGHWACGWFEILIAAPNSLAAKCAEDWDAALSDYPIASDDHYSQAEYEEAQAVWKDCYSNAERIHYVRQHRRDFEFRSFADMLGCVRGAYFCGSASELLS